MTFEHSASMQIAYWYHFLAVLLHVLAENVVTDRQTEGRIDGMTGKYYYLHCTCALRVNNAY